MIGCRRDCLPESLTLDYFDGDACSGESSLLPTASDHLLYSDVEAADYQKAGSSLSTGIVCNCLNTDSDRTLCTAATDRSNQEDMQFVSEAVFVDAVTVTAAAVDDDENISYDPHDSLYHQICSRLHSVEDADDRHRLCDSLRILLQFFEIEYLVADSSSSEPLPSFPLHLLEQYMKLVKDDVSFCATDG